MNQPLAEIGTVESVDLISPDLWDLAVRSPLIAQSTLAGQFVHVRVGDGFNPFLRRPLSVGPIAGDVLRLIFHVRGEGTRLLSAKKPGDPLDMIGPLGKPFEDLKRFDHCIFVTGGIGIVPLLLLDDQLPAEQRRSFILGSRSLNILPIRKSELNSRRILLATDDGSEGYHGNAVQLLNSLLLKEKADLAGTVVLACGPLKMLQGVKQTCLNLGIEGRVSLEVSMGCGLGACQSCAVPLANGAGYRMVCRDGPVFDCKEISLE
jgi:dihydroorotate dehydrogenase electron transfer subunit